MAIDSLSDGVLTVRVSGQLTPTEWQAAQAAAVGRMDGSPGKVSVLVIAEQFAGWTRGDWHDSPFQSEFDKQVHRLAIVGARQWKDLALLFAGKGLRRIPIEFFSSSDIEAARRWVASAAEKPT